VCYYVIVSHRVCPPSDRVPALGGLVRERRTVNTTSRKNTSCRNMLRALATPMARLGANAVAAAAAAALTASTLMAQEAPVTIETESVTLKDGRKFAYRTWGDPQGVPVIALHGMSSSHLTWHTKEPLSSIAPGILLVAIDRPGYGNSSNPPTCYSYVRSAWPHLTLPHFSPRRRTVETLLRSVNSQTTSQSLPTPSGWSAFASPATPLVAHTRLPPRRSSQIACFPARRSQETLLTLTLAARTR
jgi:hypothetical protein